MLEQFLKTKQFEGRSFAPASCLSFLLSFLLSFILVAATAIAGPVGSGPIHDSPLLGAWQTACINATSYSARNEVRFSNETMRWRGTSYAATNCAEQDFSFEMHNRYETGLNSGEHFELDYTLDKIFFVFSTKDAVRQANDYVYCGFKDWQLNVSRDVTGKDCGGTVYKAGDVTYDLIRIDQGRKIYFGSFEDGRDGKSPEGRPIAIDPHQAYLKAFGKSSN